MSENGEIYTAGKNFTLPPALTALTNFTSVGLLLFSTEPGFWLKVLERDDFTERLPRGVFGQPDYIILVDGPFLCRIYLFLKSLL